MFQPRSPLPPPRLGSSGPSPAGRTLAILIVGLLLLLAALFGPAIWTLNKAIIASIETWRPFVGGAVLLFIGLVLASVVRMLFAVGWKMEHKARQAAILRVANQMPADVRDVRNGGLVAQLLPRTLDQHYEQLLEEKRRPFPQLHSFAQHMHNTHAPALPAPELVSGPPPASIPTFGQLLDSGQIGPNKPLILGYRADTGEAITGNWNQLYSCGVGGMTGSGKSWVIAFLAGQSAAAGARIILIDPHAGDPESLANRLAGLSPAYMCDLASTPSAIESALKLASTKLDNRRAGKGGNWPILLIADEWTSMLRGKLGDLLTATALDFAEQGRKYGCFGILGAQAWQVDAAGAVRDRLASHYILRTRGDQFRYQTGLRSGSAPEDTLTLPPGQAYFLSTRGDLQRVIIPTMTQADILRLGTLVDAPGRSPAKFGFLPPTQALSPITANTVTSGRHDGDTMATSAAQVTTASGSPEAARALALLHEGRDLPAIVLEMRGVRPKEGRKYMTALADVTDLIRQATKGRQS